MARQTKSFQRLRFVLNSLIHPMQAGTLKNTSKNVALEMVKQAFYDLEKNKFIILLGISGMQDEIIHQCLAERLNHKRESSDTIIGIEINKANIDSAIAYFKTELDTSNLLLLHDNAVKLKEIIQSLRAETEHKDKVGIAVVSTLPFGTMPKVVAESIIKGIADLLVFGDRVIIIEYSHPILHFFRKKKNDMIYGLFDKASLVQINRIRKLKNGLLPIWQSDVIIREKH